MCHMVLICVWLDHLISLTFPTVTVLIAWKSRAAASGLMALITR